MCYVMCGVMLCYVMWDVMCTCIEREENVKADIFFAYITLLKQTRPNLIQDSDAMEQEEGYAALRIEYGI